MLVWANAHGGFVFGILAWAAYMAGWALQGRLQASTAEDGRVLFLVGVASLVTSVITPDSWHNWQALLQNRSPYVLGHTVETMSPVLLLPATWPFFALLAFWLIGTAYDFKKLVVAHALLLSGLAALSLIMARNIPFFAIAAAPVLSAWGARALRRHPAWAKLESAVAAIDAEVKGFVWSVVVVLAVIGWLSYQSIRLHQQAYEFNANVYPVRAVDWVAIHRPSGNMFNDFNWGGYLLYRLWPVQRVFIDSQSDFYGEALVRQYNQVMSAGSQWQAVLDQYDIRWIIVPPWSKLAEKLNADAAWQLAFSDTTATIYTKATVP